MKTKIIGAGSIGNHLAQACRRMGWEVSVIDNDPAALKRMRENIYPDRYGAWDEGIQLFESNQQPRGGFDVIFIGTQPETHLSIAIDVLKNEAPRVLQIEKPVCAPTLAGVPEFLEEVKRHPDTKIIIGFDHVLGNNTIETENLLKKQELGSLITIDAETRSHWSGIFKAHPWLSGPHDSYLGFWERGGGASGEHSHALNLWQHFAHVLGAGRVAEVSAEFDFVTEKGTNYDRLCFLTLTTKSGLVGRVVQDVVSIPKSKTAVVRFEKGRVEWHCDVTKTLDQVHVVGLGGDKDIHLDLPKNRPDEFFQEIKHIKDLIDGVARIEDSPIRLERGLDTMFVLAAAYRSFKEKKSMMVSYDY